MNPGQRLSPVRNGIRGSFQMIAGHGKVARHGVHFHARGAVLIALAWHRAAIDDVQS